MIGLLLGDGHIYKGSPKWNSRFEMSFGKDRNADHIGKIFKYYTISGVTKVEYKSSKGLTSYNYRFKTRCFPVFNYYHNLFYTLNTQIGKYIKIVPNNILEFMD